MSFYWNVSNQQYSTIGSDTGKEVIIYPCHVTDAALVILYKPKKPL